MIHEYGYVPGTWFLVARPSGVALLPADLPARMATVVWRRLESGGVAAVIDALTGAFGSSLDALPPFAVLSTGDAAMRLAVRGAVEVLIEGDREPELVSGAGAQTWVEKTLRAGARVTVTVDGAPATDDILPLAAGVVRAANVRVGHAPAGTGPVAVVTPVPTPHVEAPPVAPAADASHLPPTPEDALASADEDALAGIADLEATDVEPVDDVPASPDTDLPRIPPPPPAVPVAGPPAPALDDDDPQLFGDTVLVPRRTRREQRGDHDGETVSISQLRALRDAPAAPRPNGSVRLSDGRVIALERPVVIGRRPRAPRPGVDVVTVASPQQDISRSHVEITVEGETVLVTDLRTTNGTTLLRPGADPVRLHPGEATIVVSGDVVDLGDGVTARFEDIS